MTKWKDELRSRINSEEEKIQKLRMELRKVNHQDEEKKLNAMIGNCYQSGHQGSYNYHYVYGIERLDRKDGTIHFFVLIMDINTYSISRRDDDFKRNDGLKNPKQSHALNHGNAEIKFHSWDSYRWTSHVEEELILVPMKQAKKRIKDFKFISNQLLKEISGVF